MRPDLTGLLSGRPHRRNHAPSRDLPTVAILTMEMQRGIVGDLSRLPALVTAVNEGNVIENVSRLLAITRPLGISTIHCTAEFRPDYSGTSLNTRMHSTLIGSGNYLIAGTQSTQLAKGLIADDDFVIARLHGVSPFTGTSLDQTLRNLGTEVIIVTGVSLNLGIFGLCIEAVNLGYEVVLPVDAVAGTPRDYARSVIDESLSLITTLCDVDSLISSLSKATTS